VKIGNPIKERGRWGLELVWCIVLRCGGGGTKRDITETMTRL